MAALTAEELRIPHVAVAGNPNCGKSTVFNALTGLRQKVSNYPGKTVEKHEGSLHLPKAGEVHVIDLPGAYSMNARSMDEQVSHDVLMGSLEDTPRPRVVVVVIDASNLERNLFFATQILSLGLPTIIALNMMDLCRTAGHDIDEVDLSKRLGVPVVPMIAARGTGLSELKAAIETQLATPSSPLDPVRLPAAVDQQVERLATELKAAQLAPPESARGEALRVLCTAQALEQPKFKSAPASLHNTVETARKNLQDEGITWYAAEAIARYAAIDDLMEDIRKVREVSPSLSDKADRFLTHPVGGPAFLGLVVLAIFISIFKLTQAPMDWIKQVFGWLSSLASEVIPAGPLQSLLTDGVISGVGGVLVFLPQIMILFLFIAIMEDSGYTARAAFILDRIMGRMGLHGKAFIPLFSSFACAIPGIMAARTIDNEKDRLLTILIAPLMCCAARWPVYLLIAGTVIPNVLILGFLPLPALVLGSMVIFGLVAAIAVAAVFNRTILKGKATTLAIELPRYHRPRVRTLIHVMWERSILFVRKAGTVILAMSIIMWALTNYPRTPTDTGHMPIEHSIAGQIGKAIEPIVAPIGFDWRIGVSALSSLVAREVFVSSMATIYGVESHDSEQVPDLQQRLRAVKDPVTGNPFFTPLRGICIMLFYVLAMQCFSTLAVTKRETGSWKWTIFQWGYMTGLAWLVSFAVWQGGHLLGWG